MIPRITGLDPARPCFNEGERLSGLQRGDAKFVDIIHSNAGILGIKDPKGNRYLTIKRILEQRNNSFNIIYSLFVSVFR